MKEFCCVISPGGLGVESNEKTDVMLLLLQVINQSIGKKSEILTSLREITGLTSQSYLSSGEPQYPQQSSSCLDGKVHATNLHPAASLQCNNKAESGLIQLLLYQTVSSLVFPLARGCKSHRARRWGWGGGA